MVEVATRRPSKCKQCKRKQNYYDRSKAPGAQSSRVDLDANGLCVDCAPVNHACDRGAVCEYERLQDWRGNYAGSNALIPMLRLCDHHDAIRTERLGA